MKKVLSILLSVLIVLSCFAGLSMTANAAVTTTDTVVSNYGEFVNLIDNGLQPVFTKNYSRYANKESDTFSINVSNSGYVLLRAEALFSNLTSKCNIELTVYSNDMTKQLFHESVYGTPKAVINSRVYLGTGAYVVGVTVTSYNASGDASSTITSKVFVASLNETSLLSATYMGAVNETCQTIKVKVNSIDPIDKIYTYSGNGTFCLDYDYDMLHTVGTLAQLDSENCVTIGLKGTAGSNSYGFIALGIKDIYGNTANIGYQVLNDFTATVEGITDLYYTGLPVQQNNYSVYAGYKSNAPTYIATYDNNVNVGIATVTFTGIGITIGSITRSFNIIPAYSTPNNVIVKLPKSSYAYTGKAIMPDLNIVDDCGNKLVNGKDYTLRYSGNCKNVGKYTITATLMGNYSGEYSKSYTILPVSTSLTNLSAGNKKISVKWKKKTAQVTGYQIQYSTDSKFKKGVKTVNISKNKTTSTSIKNLKGKKKYYVRIRTYKTVGKTKYYSSWTKAKSVIVK